MKTLNWFGFIAAPRPGKTQAPGRFKRFMELMGRGSIPVDGCEVLDEKPKSPRRPEPVRWGNFR